jgi:predicted secreted Zn-dependent protease
VNEVAPVARAAPPDGAAYQSIVSPAPAIAEIVTVPAPHVELPTPVGAAGERFTTSVTEHELWHPLAFVTVTL